jgi:uncharacterized protein (UPF0276 family)
VDTTFESEVKTVLDTIVSDVMVAVKHFGSERVVVESSPCQGEDGNTMRLCLQSGLVRQVIEKTGCGLLLDSFHAIIAARSLDMNPGEYIYQLPVQNVKELHFAGIHYHPTSGRWMDYLSIQEEDWFWLEWVFKHIQTGGWNAPWLLAFEYGDVGRVIPRSWLSRSQSYIIL